MYVWGRLLRLAGLVGLAAGGLIAGHELGYRAAVPDTAHRHSLLAHTGHGYLPVAACVAGVLALAAVIAAIGLGYLRARERPVARMEAVPLFLRLAPLQAGVFVALEAVERLAAGAPLADLAGPLLWIGVLAQLVTALVGASLLVASERGGERLGLTGRSPVIAGTPVLLRPGREALPRTPTVSSDGARAPPVGRVTA